MKKLFDAINKGDFDTVKQVIEKILFLSIA